MPKFVPQIAKQTIGFHKNLFHKSFDTMMTLNEQMLKALEKVPGFPKGGKKVIIDLNKSFKKICVDFKITVDTNIFNRAEALFGIEMTELEAAKQALEKTNRQMDEAIAWANKIAREASLAGENTGMLLAKIKKETET